MAKSSTRGSNAQFTYDFGIAIAQSTITKLTRLTGVTLSLASAYYALKTTASEYVDTLRENTLRFGGMLSTMKAMQQAQDRLITGMSRFDVRDQMEGMNKLMAAGVDVKRNMDWIEKAAHATGKSFDQFSGMIASAVQGNLQGLVDAGLMTQRATKAFERFQGNTRMMQGAVMKFLQNHKGLMSAIKNDFMTVEDGMRRLRAVMTSFLQSIIGKPNDPNSLYGSVAKVFNMIADKFGKNGVLSQNMIMLRQYGEGVGIVMSWVVRKIGGVIVWLARQAKKAMVFLLGSSETFAERMRSLVVWLEFWKIKVIDIFTDIYDALKRFYTNHETLIKTIGGVLLAFTGLRLAWKVLVEGTSLIDGIIMSFRGLRTAIIDTGLSWGFLSKKMTLRMFKGAKNRKFFSLFGLTPRVVHAEFIKLGRIAGKAFSKGLRVFSKVLFAPFLAMKSVILHPIKTIKWGLLGVLKVLKVLLKGVEAFFKPFLWLRKFIIRLFSSIRMLPRLIMRFLPIIMTALVGWWKTFLGFIKNLPALLGGIFKSIGAKLAWVFKNPIVALKSLWGVVRLFFTSVINGIRAIYAASPIGWIILGVTLLVVLYKKFALVREVVNAAVKTWIEWIKFLWNVLYGAFVYTVKFLKLAYAYFKTYIWIPVKNFFIKAYGWIAEMWRRFKDSSVGKFINNYIVQPIKWVFEWVLKSLKFLLQGAAKILSVVNSAMAEDINKTAKELNLPELALSGGDYEENDSTDYLKKLVDLFGDFTTPKVSGVTAEPKNPLLSKQGGFGGTATTTNNISLSNGAVQIIVPKGTEIDEAKLARMVRDEIRNMDRETRIRGGEI